MIGKEPYYGDGGRNTRPPDKNQGLEMDITQAAGKEDLEEHESEGVTMKHNSQHEVNMDIEVVLETLGVL